MLNFKYSIYQYISTYWFTDVHRHLSSQNMEIASWSTAVDNLEVQQQQNLFFSHIKLTKHLFLCKLVLYLPVGILQLRSFKQFPFRLQKAMKIVKQADKI